MNIKGLGIPLTAAVAAMWLATNAQAEEARFPGFFPHTQKVLQETYDLSDFPGPEVVVVMDTTNVNNIIRGHVVATLPSAPRDPEDSEDPPCKEGGEPFPGLSIVVGAADNTGGDNNLEFPAPKNTGIGSGRMVDFAGETVATCVFHLDIVPGLLGKKFIDAITDIAFINGTEDSMPPGTSIGVTVKLGNRVSTSVPNSN